MTTMIVDDLGRIPMSPYLTATLTRAADYATAQSHREVTLEHLLLALAEDPEATVVLKSSHIDLARLTAEVSEFLSRSEDHIDPEGGQTVAISADLRRILEAAAAAAKQGRRREINGAIVLAAIVGDGKSAAAHLLRVQGLTFEEAIRALQRAAPPAPPPPQPAPAAPHPAPVASHPAPAPPRPAPPPPSYPAPPPQPDHEPEREEAEPRPRPDFGAPPPPDLTRPASTEEILASARERLQPRPTDMGRADVEHPDVGHPDMGRPDMGQPDMERPDEAERPERPPSPLTRTNYPDLGGPPQPAPMAPREPPFEREPPASEHAAERPSDGLPSLTAERPGAVPAPRHERDAASWPIPSSHPGTGAHPLPPSEPQPPPNTAAGTRWHTPASATPTPAATGNASPPADRRRAAPSGPFVGSWPLIESGQLIENIPRRMRVGVPVVAEARIARADVKALAEGLQGGGAAFRHEVVVTKAMSVRLRAPDGGFTIENRSPETQWIENVLGFGSDDFASWRWTVTPRARGRRPLQLIVSARTVGADGMTAETALPDQIVDVKVSINYARTAARWIGWIAAAVIGGLLAKFGETGWVIAQLLIAKHLGG